jgi:hypothetical protein
VRSGAVMHCESPKGRRSSSSRKTTRRAVAMRPRTL